MRDEETKDRYLWSIVIVLGIIITCISYTVIICFNLTPPPKPKEPEIPEVILYGEGRYGIGDHIIDFGNGVHLFYSGHINNNTLIFNVYSSEADVILPLYINNYNNSSFIATSSMHTTKISYNVTVTDFTEHYIECTYFKVNIVDDSD